MKRFFISLSIIFFATAALVSCDKIEQQSDGTYTVYAGAVGEWNAGQGVADKSQRALLEKFTGVRCNNCPTADEQIATTLDNYAGKLIAISIHDSISSFCNPYPNSLDLRTAVGTSWSEGFGRTTSSPSPAALVNRMKKDGSYDIFYSFSSLSTYIDPIISQDAKVAIGVAAARNNGSLDVTVDLEFLESLSDKLTVTLAVIEDGLIATQLLPDGHTRDTAYVHNHILRGVVTDVWGADVDCTGAAGEKRVALFSTSNVNPEWNLDNCHIVAFVSKKENREVLNVAECEIE
ncbi:MAG: Omp28-related outer membrane protein [Bacteroidales bacterium]|nr:Omp28-related outer membrane protein [Bacteroidales bacterium]